MVLSPPVEPMLAQAVESVPGPGAMGELAFEQKFDGYRALLFTGGPPVLQTRQGKCIQNRFPDLLTGAARLPGGLVLDGELVVWDTEADRLSFEGLQRRAAARGRLAAALAAPLPAFFIAFDILQQDGVELLRQPYWHRRRQLERLFATHRLGAPWTLCPMTTELLKAEQWLENGSGTVAGLEGIVVKPMRQPYQPGYRGWYKLRRRDTTEAIIGAVTGTLARPQLLLLGRNDQHGRLCPVGRTGPLRPEAARLVAGSLTAAEEDHPWTGMRFTSAWGSRELLQVTLVHPDLVAEISADTAVDHGGVYRHPVRFRRLRLDLAAENAPLLGRDSTATTANETGSTMSRAEKSANPRPRRTG